MDVSAITKKKDPAPRFPYKGKGDYKGNGKGKGDYKGKGKGDPKGTPKGKSKGLWCHNCKSNTHDTKYCYNGGNRKGRRKGVRGLWSEWDYETEQEAQTTAIPQEAVSGSTTSQQDLQSIAPPSTVAAIHYGTVVGESWDNDN